jgi:hypothetical protein
MIVEFAAEAHGANEALNQLDALIERFRALGLGIERDGPDMDDSEDGGRCRYVARCEVTLRG